jgi:Fe-S cluster biogenesis protein NfuA
MRTDGLKSGVTTMRSSQTDALENRVSQVLDVQIKPLLLIHGGGIDLLRVNANGHVELEFQGACRGCALQTVTYAVGVRQRMLEIPGVSEVEVKGVRISKMALKRTAEMYRGYSFRPGGL